ncbi:MAG: 3-phosphoshikimate 1-carboxyvinyltransferase [Muribaculaceae bacterium]|nr:3-phosphoshikimate 1-carboxyvinyltransferase [Muribaculaceae bacterium]
MKIRIFPPEEMLDARVTLPLSKSMSVRAAAMAAHGARYDAPLADCADTEAMKRVAAAAQGTTDAGDSGAALRFGAALAAATEGTDVTITGSPRLLSRPADALLDALGALGADISRTPEGAIRVRGRRLDGGAAAVDASESSQFVSALLMAAPLMRDGLTLTIDWNQPSLPYIDMTLAMMRARGIDAARDGIEIRVRPGAYRAPECPDVERDWSAAAFWYETAALTAGFVSLPGLRADSVQGDRAAAEIFSRLGVATAFGSDDCPDGAALCADPEMHARIDLDCSPMPDLVPAIAVTAAMLGVPFELSGVQALRLKECDRVEAIIAELAKAGIIAEYDRGTLSWDGRRVPVFEMPAFDAHGDHRMAMALAPVAVCAPGITISGAECAGKSYPAFWDDLAAAGFEIENADEEES